MDSRNVAANEELLQLLKFYQMTANNNLGGPANQKFRNEFLNLTMSSLLNNNKTTISGSGDIPPLPVMAPRDQSCDRIDTIIRNEVVSCFLVGGEKRLCFPQFVNSVLGEFEISDINRSCAELNIHCSPCTRYQLEILKLTNILPMSMASCNLITNTDAERLCSYLTLQRQEQQKKQQRNNNSTANYNNKNSNNNKPNNDNKQADSDSLSILIKHRCFGRCKGRYYPSKFTCSQAPCIQCIECSEFYSPEKFVAHTHGLQETRYCHWGFNSANWSAYIQLKKEFVNDKQCVKILNEMKCRFNKPLSSSGNNYSALSVGTSGTKRSAIDEVVCEKISDKRPRLEPVKVISQSSSGVETLLPSVASASTASANNSVSFMNNLMLPQAPTGGNSAIPLLLCDPILALASYYHMLANARLNVAVLPLAPPTLPNSSQSALISDSQVPPPLSMEEAAATLLKLAPQKFCNDVDLKPVKSENRHFLESIQQQQLSDADVLKKHFFNQLTTKDHQQQCLPSVVDVKSLPSSAVGSPQKKLVETDDLSNLELLLMHYVRDAEGLRRIFDKLRSTHRCHEEKVENLMNQNRILHQEIDYLRNKQQGGGACSSATSKCLM